MDNFYRDIVDKYSYTDELEDESFDDPLEEHEEIIFKKNSHKRNSSSRRRHEQLKEERELKRLLINDFNDLDNINDSNYSDDFYDPNL